MSYISSFSIVIPFVFVLFNYKKLNKNSLAIQLYVIIGVLFEISHFFQISYLGNNTIISTNIFTLIELCLILYTLYQWSLKNKYRYIYILLLTIYIIFWTLSVKFDGIDQLSSIIYGTEALFVITSLIIFFYNRYVNENENFQKWQISIGVSFLFYFIVNSGIYSFIEIFLKIEQKENWIYFSIFHFIGNLGLNIILTRGLYQCSKHL